ncbi:MAG TPA: dockerin type I domain-containing protein, partial [Armatimonadota bacterium]
FSNDDGETWQEASTGLGDKTVYCVAFDPAVPGRVFAGTAKEGVYYSLNNGHTWKAARGGLTTAAVTTLLFDPANPKKLLAGTLGEGVWSLDLSGAIDSDPVVVPPPVTSKKGDVNGDNKVSITDVILGLQAVAGLKQLTAEQLARADMNGDGKLSIGDVLLVLRVVAGLATA